MIVHNGGMDNMNYKEGEKISLYLLRKNDSKYSKRTKREFTFNNVTRLPDENNFQRYRVTLIDVLDSNESYEYIVSEQIK